MSVKKKLARIFTSNHLMYHVCFIGVQLEIRSILNTSTYEISQNTPQISCTSTYLIPFNSQVIEERSTNAKLSLEKEGLVLLLTLARVKQNQNQASIQNLIFNQLLLAKLYFYLLFLSVNHSPRENQSKLIKS